MRQRQPPFSPTKLFQDLNRQFFRGRLPRYRVVLSDSLLPSHGECLPERRLIRLRRGLDPETTRRILLHEMCHIGSLGHGRPFQAKLYLLAAQGEEWAKHEAEKYRDAVSWNAHMTNLRGTLDDVAGQSPRPNFPALVRWLTADFCRQPRELLRSVPWLRAAWKKACREADKYYALKRRLKKGAKKR